MILSSGMRAIGPTKNRQGSRFIFSHQYKTFRLLSKISKITLRFTLHNDNKLFDQYIFNVSKNDYQTLLAHEDDLKSLLNYMPIEFGELLSSMISRSRKRFNRRIKIIQDLKTVPSSTLDSFIQRYIQNSDENEGDRMNSDADDDSRKMFKIRRSVVSKGLLGKEVDEKAIPFILSMNAIRNDGSLDCLFQKEKESKKIEAKKKLKGSSTVKTLNQMFASDSFVPPTTEVKEPSSNMKTPAKEKYEKPRTQTLTDLIKIDLKKFSSLPTIKQNQKKQTVVDNKPIVEKEPEVITKDQLLSQYYSEQIKNYDILNIEPYIFAFFSRRADDRKMVDKVYNELSVINQKIKKAIAGYQTEYRIYCPNSFTESTPKPPLKEIVLSRAKSQISTVSYFETAGSKKLNTENSYKSLETMLNKKSSGSSSKETKSQQIIDTPKKLRTQKSSERYETFHKESKTLHFNLRTSSDVGESIRSHFSPIRNRSPPRIPAYAFPRPPSKTLRDVPVNPRLVKAKSIIEHQLEGTRSLTSEHPGIASQSLRVLKSLSAHNDFENHKKRYPDSTEVPNSMHNKLPNARIKNSQSSGVLLAKINEENAVNKQLVKKKSFKDG